MIEQVVKIIKEEDIKYTSREALAKAIIKGMREIPQDMYDNFPGTKKWIDSNSIEVWENWIDAALKE
jgi:hypothetical protein